MIRSTQLTPELRIAWPGLEATLAATKTAPSAP
jgi:hypothetical protein